MLQSKRAGIGMTPQVFKSISWMKHLLLGLLLVVWILVWMVLERQLPAQRES
jgi:hypothetical protein